MAFSDELKNDVIDVDSYNQEVKEYLPKLTEDYISKNNEFLNEYFSEIKFMLGIDEDISNYSFERKKDFLKKELTKYDLTFADTDSHEEEQFEKKYKEFLENQEKDKKIVIEKVIKILKYTQDEFAHQIDEFEKKIEKAKEEIGNIAKEIRDKSDEISEEQKELEKINQEIESLEKEQEELEQKISDVETEIEKLEKKDSLSEEEKERLSELENELSGLQDKNFDLREKINDKKSEKKEKDTNISDLTASREELRKNRDENLEIVNNANEELKKAKEAYLKNGEEIDRIAKENNIDIDSILNPKVTEKKEENNEEKDKEENGNKKEDKSSSKGTGSGVVTYTQPENVEREQTQNNMPASYRPDVLNDFAKCSNTKDRLEMYINNPEGFSLLANSIKNRSVFDFFKNRRVKRAILNNNKELQMNMKDKGEYIDLLNQALGNSNFTDVEKNIFNKMFDKNSNANILSGLSNYTDAEIEAIYSVVGKINSKDFSSNPEIAKRINYEIMPYIKSGILNEYSSRKPIGRFSAKNEITARNQNISYISSEITNYSSKFVVPNQEQIYSSNPFTSELSKFRNINPPMHTQPQPGNGPRTPQPPTR